MTQSVGTSQQVIDTMSELVRAFPQDRWGLGPKERLDLALRAQSLSMKVQAVAAMLLAEADNDDAAMRATGTPAATLLAAHTNLPRNRAAALLHQAHRLDDHPRAREAALAGQITMAHVEAIARAMEHMPTLTVAQSQAAEKKLVELATYLTPDDVLQAATRVAQQVGVIDANEQESARLTREQETAWGNRSLTWWHDHQGSIAFKGCLPLVEGEAFTTLIRAYTARARHNYAKQADSGMEDVKPWQRHADALIDLINDTAHHKDAPLLAGQRPNIIVTLDYHRLYEAAAEAGLLPSGQAISAGDLRRLCCDANLIPAVLGGASQPLDVGRAGRFVTDPIRKALMLRDKHCAFPACNTPAVVCDAHHLTPWNEGGATALSNLVLLCPHHHAIIEPDPNRSRDQWKVTIHPDDGYPVFHPPHRHPSPGPVRHAHHPPIPDNRGGWRLRQ